MLLGLLLACLSGAGALAAEPTQWDVEYFPQPPNSGSGHRAYGVSCAKADECVGVGENWSLDVHAPVTLAETWNGSSWLPMETPNPAGLDEGWKYGRYALLRDVSCLSADECVAVGHYRSASERVEPLAEHWNGSEWTIAPVDEPSGATAVRLEAVSCTSATSCLAVGFFESSSGAEEPLVERWNGSEWAEVPIPSPADASSGRLLGASCPSSSACVLVGSYETGDAEKTLAMHLDGDEWTIEPAPNPGPRSEARFADVSCSSSTACTAVGYFRGGFTLVTLAERWDGTGWKVESTPTPEGEGVLWGVSCPSPDSCTAVGDYYSSLESDSGWRSLVERWDGAGWSTLETARPAVPSGWWHETSLKSVSCPRPEACTAVGDALSGPSGAGSQYRAIGVHELAPPSASFSFAPSAPLAGESVAFDGSASIDPDGAITSYTWEFGDGGYGFGKQITHIYSDPGSRNVTLTVIDDDGHTAKISHQVDVNPGNSGTPAPPDADFSIQRTFADCGRVVLALHARAAGQFSAVAVAIPAGRQKAARHARRGHRHLNGCKSDRQLYAPHQRRRRLSKWGARPHRFRYGTGSVVASAGEIVQLAIAPHKSGVRALKSKRLLLRIWITFTSADGIAELRRKSLVLQ